MRPYSRGLRVQVYFGETDKVGHVPLYQAALEYLRREGAAGATVVRGLAGFGADSKIHTAAIVRLSMDLPMVLTWIDAPGRVERLLPGLMALTKSGVVTVDEVEIAAYGGRRLEHLRFDLQVRDAMTAPVVSIDADATVRDAVDTLLDRPFLALPVVDPAGRLAGLVSNSDLVARAGLDVPLELLAAMAAGERSAILDRLDGARPIRDVMTADAPRIRATESVATATLLMADHAVKWLPVVEDGRLVGILSRSDVLRAVGETFPRDVARAEDHPGARTVGEIARPDAPVVPADADLATLLDAVVSTPLNRAVVVDDDGRVLGVISDEDVLRSVAPMARSGVIGALMRTAPRPAGAHPTARALVHGGAPVTPPTTWLADAAHAMIEQDWKVLCVVDDDGRLVGIVDRADLLRAAGAALRGLASAVRPA